MGGAPLQAPSRLVEYGRGWEREVSRGTAAEPFPVICTGGSVSITKVLLSKCCVLDSGGWCSALLDTIGGLQVSYERAAVCPCSGAFLPAASRRPVVYRAVLIFLWHWFGEAVAKALGDRDADARVRCWQEPN